VKSVEIHPVEEWIEGGMREKADQSSQIFLKVFFQKQGMSAAHRPRPTAAADRDTRFDPHANGRENSHHHGLPQIGPRVGFEL
jgi:hypothetical protein